MGTCVHVPASKPPHAHPPMRASGGCIPRARAGSVRIAAHASLRSTEEAAAPRANRSITLLASDRHSREVVCARTSFSRAAAAHAAPARRRCEYDANAKLTGDCRSVQPHHQTLHRCSPPSVGRSTDRAASLSASRPSDGCRSHARRRWFPRRSAALRRAPANADRGLIGRLSGWANPRGVKVDRQVRAVGWLAGRCGPGGRAGSRHARRMMPSSLAQHPLSAAGARALSPSRKMGALRHGGRLEEACLPALVCSGR